MTPDILIIGHVAKDLTPQGFTLGGAAAFASIAAKRLGLNPAVVTCAGPDVALDKELEGIPVQIVPSETTTTFVNVYRDGRRTQVISDVAGPIRASDIPLQWRSAPLVMLGCLTGELGADLLDCFPGSTVLAVMQGWLRQWDDKGNVYPVSWDGGDILPRVDAAILSIDDVYDERPLDVWKDRTRVLIFTRGAEGADLHVDGRWRHVNAFPVNEVDPTGAGDVFSTAYLIRYRETSDPLEAARFASCAASFCVEAEGTLGIPTRSQVEARLRG